VRKENASKAPAGIDKIEVPVKNMAVLSTTHIGMLDALKALDCVKGTTDVNFVANELVRQGVRSGRIVSFNDETSLTPERLLEKELSLVVYSGFGKAFPNEEKLKKLGILALADYDWREEHPLGKAEWIKVFGYLTGKEKAAIAYFDEVEKSYTSMRVLVKNPKSVLVGSLIGDVWYAPAGQSYMARILKDAGADYIYRKEKGTGSCERTLEQVFKDQEKADIWINAGATSLSALKDQQAKYALFTPFRTGNVYCYTHNSNYFWEMSAVNPHWILSDFSVITGTKAAVPLHFYKRLEN
jgi:iron complex transport system substrate-binding protein